MALELATLQMQLADVPDSARWSARPEIHDLAALLHHGERVQSGATGWLIESGKLAVRTWLIVATTDRLLCLLKSGSSGLRKVELNIDTMKSAYTDARLGYHEVAIESSEGKMIVSGISKEAAVALASSLSTRIEIRKQRAATAPLSADAPLPLLSDVAPSEDDRVLVLEAELAEVKKRLALVEEIIRRAQARTAARA